MAEKVDESDWFERLPTFHGLFARHSSTLLRPFSLFSLFRTSTQSLPSTCLLRPFLQSSIAAHTDDEKTIVKSFIALQTYSQQVKGYFQARPSTNDGEAEFDDGEISALCDLLEAYPAAIHFALTSWTTVRQGDAQDIADTQSSIKECIKGTFILRSVLLAPPATDRTKTTLHRTDRELLASIFRPPAHSFATPEIHLTSLFTRSQMILDELVDALRTRFHSKGHYRSSHQTLLSVAPEDALEVMEMLEEFARGMGGVEAISGSKVAKTKAQKEEDKRRALRVGMQARIMRCDLALSMTNGHMKDIKARALPRVPKRKDGSKEDGGGIDGENASPSGKEEVALTAEVSSSEVEGIHWEDLAESALIECLQHAKTLLEAHRGGVLWDQIDRADYLGEDPQIPLSPSPKSAINASKHEIGTADEESPDEDEGEGDDGEEDESDEDEDDSSENSTPDTYPCPLRSLFALHDRYEEQRLAVWTSLPTESRVGMGTYMRGEEGRVGEVWDGAGMILLLDYDSKSLVSRFGLSEDALDKWVELASRKNAKKIRRKGRKTV